MLLLKIFYVFLRIGLFAVGGAYSFLPLLEKDIVEKYSWLSREEFLEVLGMVKIFPGAISIKFATYTGYKLAGVPGVLVANLANLMAPVILIFIATYFYSRYKNIPQVHNAFNVIQLVVFAMIIAVAFKTINVSSLWQFKSVLLVTVVFFLFLYTNIHPAFLIIAGGLIGVFLPF